MYARDKCGEHSVRAPSPPLGGEGRGEGAYPRVLSALKRPSPRPSPREERGEGAQALCSEQTEFVA